MLRRTSILPHRRRREQRTNYRTRLALLRSGKPRLVVRRGTHGLLCQLVQHAPAGDRTLVSTGAKQLAAAGYKGHAGNLPAAYLLGLLTAGEAKKRGIAEAILDIGLHTSTKGSALYAAAKGAVDGGLAIPHGEAILPDEGRLAGKHVAAYAKQLKADKAAFGRQFGAYLKAGIDPEALPEHVAAVAAKLKPKQ